MPKEDDDADGGSPNTSSCISDGSLSPHTQRLLRLIESTSSSSSNNNNTNASDHDSFAAVAREQLMAQSLTPAQLWNCLGLLQESLLLVVVKKNKSTPTTTTSTAHWPNVSAAVTDLAQKLPAEDQRAFLTTTVVVVNDASSNDSASASATTNKQDHSFLTMGDLTHHWETVVQHGRVLYAVAEKQHQNDNLDCSDDYQERMQRQREILAHRLGLGTCPILAEHHGLDAGELLASSAENAANTDQSTRKQPSRKRKRPTKSKTGDVVDNSQRTSVRELLVRAMSTAAAGDNPDSSGDNDNNRISHSHRTSQQLLATEFLFHMFHPSWMVRQGAMLGILALLKAWKHSLFTTNNNTNAAPFGAWPHDLLVRSICILLLDRVSDFRHASHAVAPCRDLAAQLVAVCLTLAPPAIVGQTVGVLQKLYRCFGSGKKNSDDDDDDDSDLHNIWEVRHGALLAVQYMVNLVTRQLLDSKHLVPHMPALQELAVAALRDEHDDVQSVAAQILTEIVGRRRTNATAATAPPLALFGNVLWQALRTKPTVATGLGDLMSLLVACLDDAAADKDLNNDDDALVAAGVVCGVDNRNSGSHSVDQNNDGDAVWVILGRCLQAEYRNVRESAITAIGQVAVIRQTANHEASTLGSVTPKLLEIVEQVFLVYFTATTTGNVTHCGTRVVAFGSEEDGPDRTWKNLVQYIFEHCDNKDGDRDNGAMVGSLSVRLLLEYLHRGFPAPGAAAALSYWIQTSRAHSIADAAIQIALLHSFVPSQCEAACLLIRQLLLLGNSEATPGWVDRYHEVLNDMLTNPPACLRVSQSNADRILVDESLRALSRESFQQGLGVLSAGNADVSETVELVGKLMSAALNDAFRDNASSEALPKTDQRTIQVNATIAATLIRGRLPSKVTLCIRALMTSLKNENDDFRQTQTSEAFTRLLMLIADKEPLQKAREKIMGNVCDAAIGRSGCTAAKVLQTLASKASDLSLENSMPQVWARLAPVRASIPIQDQNSVRSALRLLQSVCPGLQARSISAERLLSVVVPTLVSLSHSYPQLADELNAVLKQICSTDVESCLNFGLVAITPCLMQPSTPDAEKVAACRMLKTLVDIGGSSLSTFVRNLLPLSMSLMTDPILECAQLANSVFAQVVRVAPLAPEKDSEVDKTDPVVEHLILGKKLPPCQIPCAVSNALLNNGVTLREYQLEGVSWLQFLQSVNLNGALCDDMGLGKTIQALVSVAISHNDSPGLKSLVVCPSTLVSHWVAEIERFFGDRQIFKVMRLVGKESARQDIWRQQAISCNLVVTSYAVMRSDVSTLSNTHWNYCILDEGHLLKNPKTATSLASRKMRARHRLILSGTPVQNHVNELWSTFDFLMPNFLGSPSFFAKEYSRTITKGQDYGASAEELASSISKLNVLHQQVLPFILRREKHHVLKELPEKTITIIKVPFSDLQRELCAEFCSRTGLSGSIQVLESAVENNNFVSVEGNGSSRPGVFKQLLFLRLLCTHPLLVKPAVLTNTDRDSWYSLSSSGKLLALAELLRECGIYDGGQVAADADASLLYCIDDDEKFDVEGAFKERTTPILSSSAINTSNSKCLIFAQFSQSLDVVEELLLKPHMPSLKYLRLDGKVTPENRYEMAESFNKNQEIRVMLISTRVGSLGLNLTGADTVIFLEHDYNPFADLQAMDRAHRIGQKKTVNVYRLVCEHSIEEKIMNIQHRKETTSAAIVNTDNSTMYSMGTEKLLDIFTFRSEQETPTESATMFDLDNLLDSGDGYANVGVRDFIKSFAAQ